VPETETRALEFDSRWAVAHGCSLKVTLTGRKGKRKIDKKKRRSELGNVGSE
jgi:hypothetical protein